MNILINLIAIISLLGFFTVMGLGITQAKSVKNNLLLMPAFGVAAAVALAYVLSANLNISGAHAFAYSAIGLSLSVIFRIKTLFSQLGESWLNGDGKLFVSITFIPIVTILVPAILIGIRYFYGDVNFDFFFNSQDSWFLQAHSVTEYQQSNGSHILPLTWSADFQGRFGITLAGAFFAKWFHINPLQFNSLLLNTLVVIFALAMGQFCKEIYGFRKKAMLIAIATLFVVLSGSYVQAYTYYLLGQISALPVFVLFCIYLKRLLDAVNSGSMTAASINKHILIIALIINALYIMYAILSFFALFIMLLSYLINMRGKINGKSIVFLAKVFFWILLLFISVRLFALPETIDVLKGWVATSSRVVNKGSTFPVFSEYLTEAYLSLLFGITNYTTGTSIFSWLIPNLFIKNIVLLICGILTLVATLWAAVFCIKNNENNKGAHSIIVALLIIIIGLSFCFLLKSSAYGIFKLETWFVPLIIPLYVFGFFYGDFNKKILLKMLCTMVLLLNIITGCIYWKDLLADDTDKHFANVRGVSGNKEIDSFAEKLLLTHPKDVALFLTNGIEQSWLANFTRTIDFSKVGHDYQPLDDRIYPDNPCEDIPVSKHFPRLLIVPAASFEKSDIIESMKGGKIVYKNNSYSLIDTTDLKTFAYLGKGAYPVEIYKNNKANGAFPEKFRWVEKGVELIIYSNKPKVINVKMDITPGYIETKTPVRNINIKIKNSHHHFTLDSRATIVVRNIKIPQGYTCWTIESPDEVNHLVRSTGIINKKVSVDPRMTNFAISHIKID